MGKKCDNDRVVCIPNFSEGRNSQVIEALAACVQKTAGATLLDYSADESHNRSVFTLVGCVDAVEEAAFCMIECATRCIDLNMHKGEHPRMGAADVVPFVPLSGVDLLTCVNLAKRLGERVANELDVPIYLYEAAATAPNRRNLADIRRGEFEGLSAKMCLLEWAPDFGANKPHPCAGATAIGARTALIAFNVNLDTSDLSVAKSIARVIRASNGGLAGCKAIGVMLHGRGQTQVSMNITDYKQAPLYRVLEFIRFEAARYGVRVTQTEIIGVPPAEALIDCATHYLQLEGSNGLPTQHIKTL